MSPAPLHRRPLSRRRRWLQIAAGLLILAVGVPTAWDFHPLSPAERRLVGVWRTPGPGESKQEVVFTPDRRFIVNMERLGVPELHGSWSYSVAFWP